MTNLHPKDIPSHTKHSNLVRKFMEFNELNGLYILECPVGYYGENCDNKCSKYCSVRRLCDRVTGQCYGGCQPGWYTKTCEQSTCFYTSLVPPFAVSIKI